jgi:glutamyl-tRNA synthetase
MLPEALFNALLRLGWGHGDDELFTRTEALDKFSVKGLGKSAARFDPQKLEALNAHYLRKSDAEAILAHLKAMASQENWTPAFEERLKAGLKGLTQRSKTLHDLAEQISIYRDEAPALPEEALAKLDILETLPRIAAYQAFLETLPTPWTEEALEQATRTYAAENDLSLGKLAGPLRLLLTGRKVSPSLFEVMCVLGPALTGARLKEQSQRLQERS